MGERANDREFTAEDIVAAYRQTEIVPVRRTWALYEPKTDPATGTMRPVPCGCALVALARADGIDPATITAGRRHGIGRDSLTMAVPFAAALGCAERHAMGILYGWDGYGYPEEETPFWRGVLAGREAAKEVLG